MSEAPKRIFLNEKNYRNTEYVRADVADGLADAVAKYLQARTGGADQWAIGLVRGHLRDVLDGYKRDREATQQSDPQSP